MLRLLVCACESSVRRRRGVHGCMRQLQLRHAFAPLTRSAVADERVRGLMCVDVALTQRRLIGRQLTRLSGRCTSATHAFDVGAGDEEALVVGVASAIELVVDMHEMRSHNDADRRSVLEAELIQTCCVPGERVRAAAAERARAASRAGGRSHRGYRAPAGAGPRAARMPLQDLGRTRVGELQHENRLLTRT